MFDGTLADLAVGMRIELHPGTDAWIFGDRYGEVVKIGRKYAHVRMDRSGRTLRVSAGNVHRVITVGA